MPLTIYKTPLTICKTPLTICKTSLTVCNTSLIVYKTPLTVCKTPLSTVMIIYHRCRDRKFRMRFIKKQPQGQTPQKIISFLCCLVYGMYIQYNTALPHSINIQAPPGDCQIAKKEGLHQK